ncbi:MoaD/ThiS family protein [Opitutales bacterium ASA1]|uniref:MoaD/ThiS family protein n=1 Tax=Congregicoccus parvus TaxID=3081749 RepID=UPI002B2BE691|nr:MoaD/ThiS family protein [Opitutales bacterium ASA1]
MSASAQGPASDARSIRVVLPVHLRTLAQVGTELRVELPAEAPVTQRTVLDAVEARHPVLRGTIRDAKTARRRPLVRFFACEQDLSHESPDAPLPEAVVDGREPYLVVGSMAGG